MAVLTTMKIKTTTIVGGGSSGWMAAAALSKLCPGVNVVLVESPDIATVGVGESTLGQINLFLDYLGLEDEDWMAACNATYKNSIRFTNFRENDGTSFQYPFSEGLDLTDKIGGVETHSELATLYPNEYTPDTFARFYATLHTHIADANKQTANDNNFYRHYSFKWDTAYHTDAKLFGEYMRDKVALPNNVKHIKATVVDQKKDDKGNLESLTLDNGTILTSDLWLDCTGFSSMLLEQCMGSEFKSFDSHLHNDSAWACRVPYENKDEEMHNYTDCHALGNGWVWHIPLWNRIGTGYVYSSKFTTAEDAKQEFIEHLKTTGSIERAENAEMYHVNMRHGRRERAWVKNVVGIGLSYGFVEPLESTGLLTTHENIVKLVEMLNRRNGFIGRTEIEAFNFSTEIEVLKFRDFISMHYSLSMRTDTPYWKYCTEEHEYEKNYFEEWLPKSQQYTNLLGTVTSARKYPDTTFVAALYIAAGMGFRPLSTKEIILSKPNRLEQLEFTKKNFEAYEKYIIEEVNKMPTHYEFLKQRIYNGIDDV